MVPPAIWLIKLVLSHLLSDFVLQSGKWIHDRRARHFRSSYLYLHTGITAILAWLFMGSSFWYYALFIFITHTIIDGWKSYQPEKLSYFLIDQALHLLVILLCWCHAFYTLDDIILLWNATAVNRNFWIILTAFVFLSFPCGILIGQMTKRWSEQLAGGAGLAHAGKWIGILERTIILILLLQNQYSAIGLLITAKGLLRFSEKDRQEEKTEYVLIGSLLSVSVSLVTGLLTNYLIAQ